jgi:hypothetical protein
VEDEEMQQHDIDERSIVDDEDNHDPPFHRKDKDGEQHINRRVRIRCKLDTGEYLSTQGTITGYLSPNDVDSKGEPAFVNEDTRLPAYLYEVECDDGCTREIEEWELVNANDEDNDTDSDIDSNDDIDDRDYKAKNSDSDDSAENLNNDLLVDDSDDELNYDSDCRSKKTKDKPKAKQKAKEKKIVNDKNNDSDDSDDSDDELNYDSDRRSKKTNAKQKAKQKSKAKKRNSKNTDDADDSDDSDDDSDNDNDHRYKKTNETKVKVNAKNGDDESDDDESNDDDDSDCISKKKSKAKAKVKAKAKKGDDESSEYSDDDDAGNSYRRSTKTKIKSKAKAKKAKKRLTPQRILDIIHYQERKSIARRYHNKATEKTARKFNVSTSLVNRYVRNKAIFKKLANLGMSLRTGPWSDEENNQLLELVEEFNEDWQRIGIELLRTIEAVKRKHEKLVKMNECTCIDDFPNIHNELKCMIEKRDYAVHISSTGPEHMADCTQEIKDRMTSKMDPMFAQSLTDYLDTCDTNSVVIIPAKQLEESGYVFEGDDERHHPHLYNILLSIFRHTPSDFVYFCNNIFKGINKHRFASERIQYYGLDGEYKTWFYIYVIDSETYNMLNFTPVGFGYFDTYFIKTNSPVKIISCFKVTYDGINIQNATFVKVYPN